MKKLFVLILITMSTVSFAQEVVHVFFETNQFALSAVEKQKLQKWINDHKDSKIVAMNGFTDEDGSVSLNDTLSQKRVATIYEIVRNQISIRDDFKTRSFGEIHAQKGDKAFNRRVSIHYLLPKDLPRENEILGIIEEKVWQPKPIVPYAKEVNLQNPNGTISNFQLDHNFMQSLHQAQPGSKLVLKNIEFVLNTFAVENHSRGKLYELLLVMQQNSTLRIEIQGHICCNTSGKEKLSTERAKAIKNFLVMHGIEASRVTFKGFGATQPLFPVPEKNEQERAANRRVEILIIDN